MYILVRNPADENNLHSNYKRLSIEQKVEMIKFIEQHKLSHRKAAETFSAKFNQQVSHTTIYRIMKQKEIVLAKLRATQHF